MIYRRGTKIYSAETNFKKAKIMSDKRYNIF